MKYLGYTYTKKEVVFFFLKNTAYLGVLQFFPWQSYLNVTVSITSKSKTFYCQIFCLNYTDSQMQDLNLDEIV